MSTKKCSICTEEKDIKEFYFNSHNKNYSFACKKCERIYQNERLYRKWTIEQRRKMWNKASKKSQLKYPDKKEARIIVRLALKKGILTKIPCSVCGSIKVEGHHNDYKKPLEVIWLCRKHHMELHG